MVAFALLAAIAPQMAWADEAADWQKGLNITTIQAETEGELMQKTALAFADALKDATGESVETAIIAHNRQFQDSFIAMPLAGAHKAPLLYANSILPKITRDTITQLGIKKVFVVNTNEAISQQAIDDLKALGLEVVEIAGSTYDETARQVADRVAMPANNTCILMSSGTFPDSMAALSYAYNFQVPIFVPDREQEGLPSELSSEMSQAIKDKGFKRVVIMGGTHAVSEDAVSQLTDAGLECVRIAGADRYGTSRAMSNFAVEEGASADGFVVCSGPTYREVALGAPLAGTHNALAILGKRSSETTRWYVSAFMDNQKSTTTFTNATVFDADLVETYGVGGSISPESLEALEARLAKVAASSDGANLAPGTEYAPQAAIDAFKKAVADVKQEYDKEDELLTNDTRLREVSDNCWNAKNAFEEIVKRTAPEWERLAGKDRYETMKAIVTEAFKTSDVVVIATGSNYPDALAASALAGTYDAPVILTQKGALSKEASDLIKKLGAKRALVMGGESALSSKASEDIAKLGVETERVSGSSRMDTSVAAMAEVAKGSAFDTVIIATGYEFPDTLSIGPWAYKTNSPIVLANRNHLLSDSEVQAIKSYTSVSRIIIVGGENAVSDKVMEQLGPDYAYLRLAGKNRYETSREIANWELGEGMTLEYATVTTGGNFADALAGAALCGKNNSVMVLAKNADSKSLQTIFDGRGKIGQGYFLGGEKAVSADVANAVEKKTA